MSEAIAPGVRSAFWPRVKRTSAIGRRVRRRDDFERRIASFLEDVRAGRVVPEAIEPVLRDVLDDPTLELLFWLPESAIYVDAGGRRRGETVTDGRVSTPVTCAGNPLGMVLHRPIDPRRPTRLAQIVEAAGLAIEIVGLRVELRRHLAQAEASRDRIVAAGYAERRRIERDLHDGAQQRLVSVGLALRHAQHELGPSAGRDVLTVLDGAVCELGLAVEELRELARGVRPAQLDRGLAPALRALGARCPISVEIRACGARFSSDLEAAAYFVASEGLTNAVKHASATRVKLRAERAHGHLVVSVSDDGVGGASPAKGSGLRGLADRVDAHRGTLRLESVLGRGTTLEAMLPCA